MVRKGEGLTKIYGRFHNPRETDADIVVMRELHDAVDHTVLDAYGWTGGRPKSGFFSDHESGEPEIDDGARRYRYHWPNELRQKVLAWLLELNVARATQEADAGYTRGSPEALGPCFESTP